MEQVDCITSGDGTGGLYHHWWWNRWTVSPLVMLIFVPLIHLFGYERLLVHLLPLVMRRQNRYVYDWSALALNPMTNLIIIKMTLQSSTLKLPGNYHWIEIQNISKLSRKNKMINPRKQSRVPSCAHSKCVQADFDPRDLVACPCSKAKRDEVCVWYEFTNTPNNW